MCLPLHYIDGVPFTDAQWMKQIRRYEVDEPTAFINGTEIIGEDPIRAAINREAHRLLERIANDFEP